MGKKTPHKWRKYRSLPWLVCRCCGLVWLNNDVSRRAAKAGCEKE
jgi:hypothetical protein